MGPDYIEELNQENDWSHTWNNLLAVENGKKVTYTVKETSVPNGYVVSYSNKDNQLIVTNKHIPQNLEIQLQKVDEEGNVIGAFEAIFAITGTKDITTHTTNGIIQLDSQKIIGDTFEFIYKIKETKPPIGIHLIL